MVLRRRPDEDDAASSWYGICSPRSGHVPAVARAVENWSLVSQCRSIRLVGTVDGYSGVPPDILCHNNRRRETRYLDLPRIIRRRWIRESPRARLLVLALTFASRLHSRLRNLDFIV